MFHLREAEALNGERIQYSLHSAKPRRGILATTLGLVIPPQLYVFADEVIE